MSEPIPSTEAHDKRLLRFLFGPPRNPFDPETRRHISLAAFMAWIGLGADGLSSSCYGPQEAFLALGTEHAFLGLYLAVATMVTVFIIAIAYNQVIELFPSGGGGYRVASKLIGPHAGLISGAALIVDYVLTIAISTASGVDALFSLLPVLLQPYKLVTEAAVLLLLILLNLRGMKESVRVLMPIFLGFVGTHALLILYGIGAHGDQLGQLWPETIQQTAGLGQNLGWGFVAALFLRAYSLGGGTYTGLEAVSNNVAGLAEPRVQTGQWTMFYMAASLSLTAGGIILLYLLWGAMPVEGQTLNAVVFQQILHEWHWHGFHADGLLLPVVLACEAGLLFVGANTGFLGGPTVLANMASDRWVPLQFSHLSSRLVAKYGILLMGLSALLILLWSRGEVALLVVLYSINVFITFTLSLLGLCRHWWRLRREHPYWYSRLLVAGIGLLVTTAILGITLVEKFMEGGWVTLLITSMVVFFCLLIRQHYEETGRELQKIEQLYAIPIPPLLPPSIPLPDKSRPTAVFMVGKLRGSGIYTLNKVQELFKDYFVNFIFISVGEVDSKSYGGEEALEQMQLEVNKNLAYFLDYCHQHGLAAATYAGFGTDTTAELANLAEKISIEYPHAVFFAGKLIFNHDNWLTRLLHNQTASTMQRILHLRGILMVMLPMKGSIG